MSNRSRAVIAAIAVTTFAAIAASTGARADELAAQCAAASRVVGFDPGCVCLDTKVADGRERRQLIAYFTMQTDLAKGDAPVATAMASVTEHNGIALMGKYSAACVR